MSIANKFNIPPALLETIKRMNAEGTEYQEKVKALLKKKGFTSIGQMSPEEKKDFFNTLDSMHKAKNEEVKSDVAKSFPASGVKKHTAPKGVSTMPKDKEKAKGQPAGSLKKEEVELDEAFPKSTQYALVHSSSKKIVAKGNKKEMTKKVKELNAKEKGSHYVGISYGSKVGDTFGFGPSPADKLSVRNEEVEKLDEVKVGDKVHLGLKQKGGSGMRGTVHKIEGDKVHVNLGKEKFGDRIVMGSMKNVTKEEVELEEAKSSTGYDLYHKDFSSAMAHAYDFAKKKYNIEIDPLEIDRNVAMGPRKPSSGKANAYRLLDKTGKKAIQVQVANLDNKRYELNMYKEDVELEENLSSSQRDTHFSLMNKHGVLAKSAKGAEKDKHRMAALDHQMALRNPDNSQRRSNALSLSNKLGVKEEVELDEAINHLQMAKHHQALAKEHDRISHKSAGDDVDDLSIAHTHQSEYHQDAAKAHLKAHQTGNKRDVAAAKKATKESLQNDTTNIMRSNYTHFYNVTGKGNSTGEGDHKDYNYSNLRSGADAIKKGLKEEVELDESMSAAQIKKLRDAYGNIDKIDVSGQSYKNLVAFLDKQNLDTLKMLAGAKIKFISPLAQNRVVRKMNESIGSTVGGALGQYAGAKIGMEGPGRAHGEVLGRQLEKFARELFKKLTGEEIELDEEETKEFMVKFEKQGKVSVKNYTGKSDLDVRSKAKVDAKRMGMTVASIRLKEEVEEAVNPQKSMKRAGLSVERAKEVMRHQKEIGTIRKKRESLRNSFDPVNTVIEAYKKNKMKKEATVKDKNKTVHSGDKLSGKTEPIEIDPELKEQKT